MAALVARQASARDRVASTVQAMVVRLWRQFHGHYDDRAVTAFAAQSARVVRTGQSQTANLTQAYLLRVLAEMGHAPRRPADLRLPPDLRQGVTVDEEFERIVREYRYHRSQGVTVTDSSQRAETRATLVADSDLTLAMREATRQTLVPVKTVTGYRRVIHPELSKGGTCGLCVVASDRVYSVEELLPVHARCACTVAPIVGKFDPGHRLNRADLEALYAAAGSTGAEDLKRTRYKVHQHSELGPTLVAADDHWKGRPSKKANRGPTVGRTGRTEVEIRAELAALEKSYATLLERELAGENVARPLAYQRDRIAKLRKLI